MKRKLLILLTLIAFLLSACGSFGTDSLNGTGWKLVAMGDSTPVSGATLTITFENGQVSGHSGCNSYGGTYQVHGDKLEFGQMMSTLMACADASMMEQESTFMRFLGDAQRFEIVDGQLNIYRSDGGALIFVSAKQGAI